MPHRSRRHQRVSGPPMKRAGSIGRSRAASSTLAFVAFLMGCDYNVERRHFVTRDAARSAGEEGWLPEFLPPSASDINVWQNGDSGAERGAARFDPAEVANVREQLAAWKRVPSAPPPVDFAWWPTECRASNTGGEGAGLETYIGAPPLSKAVAIKPTGIVCWWTTHA